MKLKKLTQYILIAIIATQLLQTIKAEEGYRDYSNQFLKERLEYEKNVYKDNLKNNNILINIIDKEIKKYKKDSPQYKRLNTVKQNITKQNLELEEKIKSCDFKKKEIESSEKIKKGPNNINRFRLVFVPSKNR